VAENPGEAASGSTVLSDLRSYRLSSAVSMTAPLPKRWLFALGDTLFLFAVSLGTSAVMYLSHTLNIPFVSATLGGMLAAMALQVVMAVAISPLLGSIESMVPSMVLGMLSPMVVCLAHLAGVRVTLESTLMIGAGTALLFHLYLHQHALSCRRRFAIAGGKE